MPPVTAMYVTDTPQDHMPPVTAMYVTDIPQDHMPPVTAMYVTDIPQDHMPPVTAMYVTDNPIGINNGILKIKRNICKLRWSVSISNPSNFLMRYTPCYSRLIVSSTVT